jgi:hypothetical protein
MLYSGGVMSWENDTVQNIPGAYLVSYVMSSDVSILGCNMLDMRRDHLPPFVKIGLYFHFPIHFYGVLLN